MPVSRQGQTRRGDAESPCQQSHVHWGRMGGAMGVVQCTARTPGPLWLDLGPKAS